MPAVDRVVASALLVNEIELILGKEISQAATSKAKMPLLLFASNVKALLTRTEPEMSLAKHRRAVGNLLVDNGKARTELGLGRTPLHDMLAETIAWLEQVGLYQAPATRLGGTS